jgi:hypothetical protein
MLLNPVKKKAGLLPGLSRRLIRGELDQAAFKASSADK